MEPVPERTLYLLIGPPGCGKSAVAWQLVHRGALRVSGDDLFFAITDRTHSHWRPFRVMDAVNEASDVLIEGLVRRGLTVVVDRTHLTRSARSGPIAIAAKHGYKVKGLLWRNFDRAFTRNAARGGRDRVPDAIWASMCEAYQEPELGEGLASLEVVAEENEG